jgi:hypothetical protein
MLRRIAVEARELFGRDAQVNGQPAGTTEGSEGCRLVLTVDGAGQIKGVTIDMEGGLDPAPGQDMPLNP